MEVCLQASILKFCYDHSQSLMNEIDIMMARVYHEIHFAPEASMSKLIKAKLIGR